ncbi:hypothetical protein MP228_008133 [Amoeboaphelidium protococcarum]|nr:hypothetical protein MP228_008133 [Amoeboaphelidium protococcarum]
MRKEEFNRYFSWYTKEQVLQVGERAGQKKMVGTKSQLIEKVVNDGLSVQQFKFSFVNGFSEDKSTRLLSQIGLSPFVCSGAAIMANSIQWIGLDYNHVTRLIKLHVLQILTQDELLNTTHKTVRIDTVFFIIEWYNGIAFSVTLVHQLLAEVRLNPPLEQDGAQSPQNDGPLLGNVAQTSAFFEQSEAPPLNPFTMAQVET